MHFDQFKRREFITLLGCSTAVWPFAALAQRPPKAGRIGYLGHTHASLAAPYSDAFRAGLRDLGYVEGKDFIIDFRFAGGSIERLHDLAAELVRLDVDVILAYGPGVDAAHRATTTIPIVMATYADAVATTMVASLSHPGGNITGSTFFLPELMAKRVELLKEVAPSMTQVGLVIVQYAAVGHIIRTTEETAKALKMELRPFVVRGVDEVEHAFSAMTDRQIGGVVIHDSPVFVVNAKTIAGLAAKYQLSTIGPLEFPANGGLMAYGVNFLDMFRRSAFFVDKILKGMKPADIPVEQATKFETVINLKTAKALGIELPTSIMLRADKVIE